MGTFKVDYDKMLQARNTFKGFINEIGFELKEVSHLYAKGEIALTDMHRNPIGSTHGGVAYSLADTVGGVCANTVGMACTTISGNMNYLNPAMNCEKMIGEATPIKIGKRLAVVQVSITNEFGKDIAHATMTYQYLPDKEFPYKNTIKED